MKTAKRKDKNAKNYYILSNTRQVCLAISVYEVSIEGRTS